MKKLFYCLSLSLVLTSVSCQKQVNQIGDFQLLPIPQKFEVKGSSLLKYENIRSYFASPDVEFPVPGEMLHHVKAVNQEAEAEIFCDINEKLDIRSEGYTIDIADNQIRLVGKDTAGLFYALKTLEQLLEDAQEQDVCLPLCSIRDYPLLSYRAIHLDMKHHLETREYYYQLIDRLSRYKINAIIAEMEDKIHYGRRPELSSADALSIEEWKSLSDYAKARHIEISPLIQGLGHASFVLKHEKYLDLRDDPESDWAFDPLNPKTYEVQFDMYLDAIEATPHGRYLHIGGDEVQTTGRGSGKTALELQMIWLGRVCTFLEEQGRIPIFWDDMVLKHAGVYNPVRNAEYTKDQVEEIWRKGEPGLKAYLDRFPKNCIYMRWSYFTPQAIGNLMAMDWFRRQGMQVMGATAGQTRWFLMPLDESNIESIKSFALSSIDLGLNGLLLTLWDDDSPHFELYFRGILAFAEYTWTGNKRSKDDVKKVFRHRQFSHLAASEDHAFIDELEESVAYFRNALIEGNNRRNHLKRHEDPIKELIIGLPDKTKRGEWSETYAQRLGQAASVSESRDRIAGKIDAAKSRAIRNTYALEVYEQVNELTGFVADMLLTIRDYDLAPEDQKPDLFEAVKRLSEEFAALRDEFERVYSKTRVLNKPEGYLLDQDHHVHLANQTVSFDWQFLAELLFLEKIDQYSLR